MAAVISSHFRYSFPQTPTFTALRGITSQFKPWCFPSSSVVQQSADGSSRDKDSPVPRISSFGYKCKRRSVCKPTKLRALTEEENALVPEQESTPPADQTVSIAVSPSDILTMLFQAEGAMADSAVPSVIKALEGVEGITDLKVQVSEGIASVELTKQTTVQATGVASNLVEIIQASGFRLQTLNLSFQDEQDFI